MKQQSATFPIAGHKPTSRYLCASPDLDYFRIADNPGVDRFGQPKGVLGTIRRMKLQIVVIRQAQSSQLQGTLFPSISFMIFVTSFSSASLRRRSQSTQYRITGYCMSTQTTSNTTQALG
jgi:hypothetical protein